MTVYNVYRARKAEREHPPTGQFVTVDGVRLHYIERGDGPPVVLLHGNVVTARDFDTSGVLDLVAKRHRVIAFDRPGFGYSDRPHGSAWSAGTQADLLRDAFTVLGINRPIGDKLPSPRPNVLGYSTVCGQLSIGSRRATTEEHLHLL
jgi:pimeloyl-ACP methyl ester carboxylesterase